MTKITRWIKYFKSFLQRYCLLIIWISFIVLIFWSTFKNFKTNPKYYYLRTILGWWLCISRGTAPVLIICSFLVLLPVCRSIHTIVHCCLAKLSTRILAAWLSRVQVMHIFCATTLIIFSIIHTSAHIMNTIQFSKYYNALYPEINLARFKDENPALLICTWTGYSGIGMLILLLLMAMTSTTKFRNRHFNAFYITHHLFVLYLVLLFTHPFSGILKEQYNTNQHTPGCILYENMTITDESFPELIKNHPNICKQPPKFKCMPTQSWIWVLITFIIYTVDLGYRKYQGSSMEAIQACQIVKNAIHLKLKAPKKFTIDSGQYILLQCNQISSIEWHPFTVTKCPENNSQCFEVLISVRGDWTKSLQSLVTKPFCFNEYNSYISRLYHKPLRFLVDGPFSSPMQSLKHCNYAICVAAGIGITSYIATFRYLLSNKTQKPKRIHLLWLTRNPKQFIWYAKLLCDIQNKFWNENQPDRFRIQLFVTQKYKNYEIELFKNHPLYSRINTGRPNWKEEFRILNYMYKGNNVSVFCCGPKTLIKDLQKCCFKANRKGYAYTFIQEGF